MAEADVLMLVDGRGDVVEWSREAEDLLGLTPAEALGRPAASLLPSPDADLGTDVRLRLRPVLRPDGSPVWAVSSDAGRPAADDTLDAALATAVFTQSPVGLHILDTDLRLLRFNDAAAHAQAADPRKMVGCSVAEVYPDCDPARIEALLRQVLATGSRLRGHLVRYRRPSAPAQERVYSVSAFRLVGPDERVLGIAVSVADVTCRERARERLALLHKARIAIGRTMDVMQTAAELADVTVPRFADATAVDLLDSVVRGADPLPGPVDPDMPMRRAGFRSRHSELGAHPVGGASGFRFPTPYTQSLTDLQPRLVRDLPGAGGDWLVHDPERAERLQAVGTHSLIVVPLTVRGAALGLASFYRTAHPEPFDEGDLALAVDLAARTALCVDNARRFTREHTVAVTLQRHLVRNVPPRQEAADIAKYYLPAGAGGDWFDIIPLSGARIALVVGDVTGTGLRAAATMARLRTAIDALAVLDLEPDELLARLDDTALRIADESVSWPKTGSEPPEPLRATCLYMVYDPLSRGCSAASAGHPGPLLTHPDGTVEALEVPTGPPLGEGGLPFDAVELPLAEGSLLTLYTEGLLRGAEHGNGLDLLKQAVAHPDRPLKDICDAVVYALLPSRPQDDAVLLLARTRTVGAGQVAVWPLPCEPSAAATARRLVRERLAAWGLADEVFTTELIASELVTNAVRYGSGPIRLRLIHNRSLTCEVFDAGSSAPRLRHARANDEGGRGLFIVARLAQGWGTRYTAGGKVIWAQQPLGQTEG